MNTNSLTHFLMNGEFLGFSIYSIYGYSTLLVICICLLVRMAFGASPYFLLRTRFYEILPIRLIIHFLYWSNWIAILIASYITFQYSAGYINNYREDYAITGGVALSLVLLGIFPVRLLLQRLVQIPNNSPPAVSVQGIEKTHGVDRAHLSLIGSEQFPQMIVYGHKSGLGVRLCLAVLGFSMMGLFLFNLTEWGQSSGIKEA